MLRCLERAELVPTTATLAAAAAAAAAAVVAPAACRCLTTCPRPWNRKCRGRGIEAEAEAIEKRQSRFRRGGQGGMVELRRQLRQEGNVKAKQSKASRVPCDGFARQGSTDTIKGTRPQQ
jgi:hypothetical protein